MNKRGICISRLLKCLRFGARGFFKYDLDIVYALHLLSTNRPEFLFEDSLVITLSPALPCPHVNPERNRKFQSAFHLFTHGSFARPSISFSGTSSTSSS